MYDKDGSGKYRWSVHLTDKTFWAGSIELKEMVEIVSTLYDMEGVGGVSVVSTCDFENTNGLINVFI